MIEKEKDVRLKTQSEIGKILSKLHRSNTPKGLDHAKTCKKRCPHCKRCLSYYIGDGKRFEPPSPKRFNAFTGKVLFVCYFCGKPLSPFSYDPASRKLSKGNSLKLLDKLR